MKRIVPTLFFLPVLVFGANGLAQTSSAKTTLTVTAAHPPMLAVTVTPSASSVEQGQPVTYTVKVVEPASSPFGTPVGAIELMLTPAGATAPTMVNTYSLSGSGLVVAKFVASLTMPVGSYTVEVAYCSSMQVKANYATSPDCK